MYNYLKRNNMENSLTLAQVKSALPSLMSNYSYDEFDRMFHTPAYVTDRAAYYQGARLSDKIAVVFDFGNGYRYRFLNGVRIYGSDGQGGTKLLAFKRYPMYNGAIWSERVGREAARTLLSGYIQDQCALLGLRRPSAEQAGQLASSLLEEAETVTDRIGAQIGQASGPALLVR